MAFNPITGSPTQYSTDNNELASGYYLKFYQANTTTPLSVATDSTGGTLLAKVKLNAAGYPISNPLDDETVFIPHVDRDYRIVLYTNETDADNNATASAEWNVNPISARATAATTSDNVTLKNSTLQAITDYDRSPLFVDGTDFTAGAPPHVITAPSGWNPLAGNLRFWKLASDSTITSLNISATTSTTFTVNESLLSTDVVFIGDDTNRNIHDGDPADIRDRLSVYSQAETYSQSEVDTLIGAASFQDAVADVSGYVKAESVFSRAHDIRTNAFTTLTTTSTWESIGRTGSGATYTWTELDTIPNNAVFIDLEIRLAATNSVGTVAQQNVWFRESGSSELFTDCIGAKASFSLSGAGSGVNAEEATMLRIPVNNANKIFEIYRTETADSGRVVQLKLTGFGV